MGRGIWIVSVLYGERDRIPWIVSGLMLLFIFLGIAQTTLDDDEEDEDEE